MVVETNYSVIVEALRSMYKQGKVKKSNLDNMLHKQPKPSITQDEYDYIIGKEVER